MLRVLHVLIFIFFQTISYLITPVDCCHAGIEIKNKYPPLECEPPAELIHYKTSSEKYPCFYECSLAPHRYCPPGTITLCDQNDFDCECRELSKVCQPVGVYVFRYFKNRCHCKFHLPFYAHIED